MFQIAHASRRYNTTLNVPVVVPDVGRVEVISRNYVDIRGTTYFFPINRFCRSINVLGPRKEAIKLYMWESLGPGATVGKCANERFPDLRARIPTCPWPQLYLEVDPIRDVLIVVLQGTKADPRPFASDLLAWLDVMNMRCDLFLGETFCWHDPADWETLDLCRQLVSMWLWDHPHHPYRFQTSHLAFRGEDLGRWRRLLATSPARDYQVHSLFLQVVRASLQRWRDTCLAYLRLLRPWLEARVPSDLWVPLLNYVVAVPWDDADVRAVFHG
jgi:hypothetical protein